jgi:hypothetical protein
MATRELLQTEDPIEKWRREGEAKDRAFEQESERRQAEEARIVREQRQAAEMPEVLLDAIGAAMAEYVGKKLAKLEARLDASKPSSAASMMVMSSTCHRRCCGSGRQMPLDPQVLDLCAALPPSQRQACPPGRAVASPRRPRPHAIPFGARPSGDGAGLRLVSVHTGSCLIEHRAIQIADHRIVIEEAEDSAGTAVMNFAATHRVKIGIVDSGQITVLCVGGHEFNLRLCS